MRQIEDNIIYGGQKMSAQDMLVERIDNLCKERNMSYYTLSYNSTVPLTTLMHIMNKSTLNPGIITISKICDGFGITMKEFFDSSEFDGLRDIE
jgi:transcriptional regulator with XRE-family HTH domain